MCHFQNIARYVRIWRDKMALVKRVCVHAHVQLMFELTAVFSSLGI